MEGVVQLCSCRALEHLNTRSRRLKISARDVERAYTIFKDFFIRAVLAYLLGRLFLKSTQQSAS